MNHIEANTMLGRSGLLGALLAAAVASTALAQTDPYAMAHRSAANQLGMLEYCQAQGFVGADAIGAEHDAIALLPASPVRTEDAEALGRQGSLAAPNGTTMSIASMAGAQNTTVAAICRQMGSATVQMAAALKQGGTAGAMPGMPPGMPAMPTGMPSGMPAGMPSGMPAGMPGFPAGMPTLGSMPSVPGAPAR